MQGRRNGAERCAGWVKGKRHQKSTRSLHRMHCSDPHCGMHCIVVRANPATQSQSWSPEQMGQVPRVGRPVWDQSLAAAVLCSVVQRSNSRCQSQKLLVAPACQPPMIGRMSRHRHLSKARETCRFQIGRRRAHLQASLAGAGGPPSTRSRSCGPACPHSRLIRTGGPATSLVPETQHEFGTLAGSACFNQHLALAP